MGILLLLNQSWSCWLVNIFYLLISYFAVSGRDILEPIPDTGLNDP
jgi:hypothetical protein